MAEIKNGFDQAKTWWESKTIIATLLGVLSTVLGIFGYDLGNVVDIIWSEAGDAAGQIDGLWISLQSIFLGLVAAWGRIKAEVKIQ